MKFSEIVPEAAGEPQSGAKRLFKVYWGEKKGVWIGAVRVEARTENEAKRIFKRDYSVGVLSLGPVVVGPAVEVGEKLQESATSLTYDQRKGIGAVPDNDNIDYLGFKVLMRPSQFLRLVRARDFSAEDSNIDGIMGAIREGKPIGSPFLSVDLGDGDGQTVARVSQHEGRTRMEAIRRLYGDVPVEVHIFPRGGLRARHITPEAARSFQKIAYPERQSEPLEGPHFQLP